MKYRFEVYKYFDHHQIPSKMVSRPVVIIENYQEKYGIYFADEMNNLYSNPDYLSEIVLKLDELLKGKIEFYDGFGYEVYVIECTNEKCKVFDVTEKPWKLEAEMPTIEVFEFMRDWRDYVIEFNNGILI